MFAHACTYVCSTCAHMCALIAHAVFQWYTYVCPTCTHMCPLNALVSVPCEHTCVPRVRACDMCVLGARLCVCFTRSARLFVFQLNTCVRAPQVTVHVCAHGRASACTDAHARLNDRALAQPHLRSRARARPLSHALAQPQFPRGAEARSTPATHVQQRNACRVHDCIILFHPC